MPQFLNSKSTILTSFVLIILSVFLMSNRGGSPGGRSGSEVDNSTCGTNGGCHGSTPRSQEMLSSNIPKSGYIPNQEYEITIQATKMGTDVWGFEMMTEDESKMGVEGFKSNADGNIKENGVRITHKFASSSNADGQTWTLVWTAPDAGSGNLKFYVSVLAANGNGVTSGDNVFIDTLSVSENLKADVNELVRPEIMVYPNPVESDLHISGFTNSSASIEIWNNQGQLVLEQNFANQVSLARLESGIYYLRLRDGNQVVSRTFVKK